MKTIVAQVRAFLAAQKPVYLLLVMLLCAAGIWINYTQGLKHYLKSASGAGSYLVHALLYASFTLMAYLLYSLTHREFGFWKKPGFILLLLLGFFIFSFRSSFSGHARLIEMLSSPERAYLNRLVYSDLFRLSYLFIPLAAVWFFMHRKEQPLYGLSARNHQWSVYLLLLLCMVPLIAFASTRTDFLQYYPRLRKLMAEQATLPELILYELCYGIDFIAIELFFRGFMILAFAKYVGIHAVLPAACFYVSIHFGKPMGETISSFFGGTVLGIITYHSRSIYGGFMVHAGIAWMMEAGGLIGNWLRAG